MKKVIASASLVAVGATGLQGANAPGLTRMETSKPWSIAASIRGFYDDNYTVRPSGSSEKRESFGFEFAPSVAFHIPTDQTYFGGSYAYSMKYYEDRSSDAIDQTHTLNLDLDHRFSERYRARAKEQFVYSDEPELVDQNTPLRQDATGFRNIAKVEFIGVVTERVGASAGYQNNWYGYDDDNEFPPTSPQFFPSRSALLDRLEHLFNIDARYQYTESIVTLVGYQFGIVDYTGDDFIASIDNDANPLTPPLTRESDDKDNITHYLYVGADGNITEKLTGSGRVGVQYTDYTEFDDTEISPYVELSATYTYLPGSYVQAGVRHFRNATDVSGIDVDGDVAVDQESTAVYASVNHRITSRLNGTAFAQYQNSKFNGGIADGETDAFFFANAGLDYEITKNLYAEAKYNFDRLDSDRPDRSFTRNRVSLGLRAKY